MATQTFSVPVSNVGPTPYVSPSVTLPATTSELDMTLVCPNWDSLGVGTLWWQVQRTDGQGNWQCLAGQGYESGEVPPFAVIASDGIQFGARSKSGGMPSVGIVRAGLGGLVVRAVVAASSVIQAGATIVVQD